MFLFGFAFVDFIVGQFTGNPIFKALLFFAIIGFISDIINTPFSVYDIFVIEEKFGFNKMTPKLFILDKLKSWLLSLIVGGALIYVILWFYYKTTDMFWIYAWVIVSVFMVFFAMFYSNLIVPLFNKQIPLEEGDLKKSYNEFALKVGFKLDNIYTIDMVQKINQSKRLFYRIKV